MLLENNQIKEIEKMLKENLSKKEIAKKVGISEPTLRKRIKQYGIKVDGYKKVGDRSNYSMENAEYIKANIAIKNKQIIANELSISLPTLNNIIKEFNIDTSSYKRKNMQKTLSEEELETFKDMLSRRIRYSNIATHLNINRNLIPELIKRHGLEVNKKYSINEELKIIVIEMYKDGFGIDKIARFTNIEKRSIEFQLMKIDDLKSKDSPSTDMELQYINKIAKIQKRFFVSNSDFTEDEVRYVYNNLDKKPVYKIAEDLNRFEDEVIYIINSNKYRDSILKYDKIFSLPFGEEFEIDLKNIQLMHSTVGRKYGISATTVRKWREKRYGDFETRINIFLNKTNAEIVTEKILKDIDIAYFYNKEIEGFKPDFYIGKKCIIETQGDYWHSLDKNIKNDESKFEALTNEGYKILYIFESELRDYAASRKKISNFIKQNINF